MLHTLVVSTDPVAADAVALGLTKWAGQTIQPREVEHIRMAGVMGVGQADLKQIKIIKKRT